MSKHFKRRKPKIIKLKSGDKIYDSNIYKYVNTTAHVYIFIECRKTPYNISIRAKTINGLQFIDNINTFSLKPYGKPLTIKNISEYIE